MKILIQALVCFSLVVLTGCATFGDKTVNITQQQVQAKLQEQLSLPLTVLKIFDVNLSNPQVTFDGKTERMTTTLDTKISNPLSKALITGKTAISGRLKFDPATNAVMLTESKVDKLDLQGLGGKYSELLSVLGAKLGSELLDNIPLYTLKPEELKSGNTYYTPKLLKVTDGALQVTLTPMR